MYNVSMLSKEKNKLSELATFLESRGFVEQYSTKKLSDMFESKRNVYLGIDPTSDSLHVGHLTNIFLLKHLKEYGFKINILIGGATGMVGDPKEDSERVLMKEADLRRNEKKLRRQIKYIVGNVAVFNNLTWLSRVDLLSFLRDIGKHFTANQLVKREIIKKRLDSQIPISFTEFSYSLLQAYDFWYLFNKKGIDMQIGGSDQWANIISGVDLVHYRDNKTVYGLTTKLVTDKSTGKKFGKTEGNAVWIDKEKTEPFDFYQFWINVRDDSVMDFLRLFTFLSNAEIDRIGKDNRNNVKDRLAQKRLAFEVTKIIHGKNMAEDIRKATKIIYEYKGDLTMGEKSLIKRCSPHIRVLGEFSVVDALYEIGFSESRGDAKKSIESGAVYINNRKVLKNDRVLNTDFNNGIAYIKQGKKVGVLFN